jgi:hypothetical protein
MARSERQGAGTRSGVGTLTRPGARPRQQQEGEAGQGAPEPRGGRPQRPVPPQRPAASQAAGAGQRAEAGASSAERRDSRIPAARQRANAGRGAGGRRGAPQAVAPPPQPRGRTGVPPQAPPAQWERRPRRDRVTGPQPAVAPAVPAQPRPAAVQPEATAARLGSRRMPFVLLLCGLLGGALVSALVISTTLAEGSFQITSLQASTSSLAKQQQALEEEVAQAQAPQQIAQRASQLGMRRAGELWFLDLATGKVTNDGPTWSGAAHAPGYAP